MKIFCSVTDAAIVVMFYMLTKIKLNVMISYNNLRGNAYTLGILHRDKIEELYLDSGAYSVSTGRANIRVTEYKKYTLRFGSLFDQHFSLDDDFNDPEKNMANQIYLEEDLPTDVRWPIPVIHDADDPLGEFQSYVDMGHDYIAIGSNRKLGDEIFEKIKTENPDVKIHMFGNVDRRMLDRHRPYSADTATWGHASGYGQIYYWDPEDQRDYKLYVGERNKPEKGIRKLEDFEHKQQVLEFLRRTFGFTYRDLLERKENQQLVNIYFFYQLQDVIRSTEEDEAKDTCEIADEV